MFTCLITLSSKSGILKEELNTSIKGKFAPKHIAVALSIVLAVITPNFSAKVATGKWKQVKKTGSWIFHSSGRDLLEVHQWEDPAEMRDIIQQLPKFSLSLESFLHEGVKNCNKLGKGWWGGVSEYEEVRPEEPSWTKNSCAVEVRWAVTCQQCVSVMLCCCGWHTVTHRHTQGHTLSV